MATRKIVEVVERGRARATTFDRIPPWWQMCTVAEFQERIEALSPNESVALLEDMKAVIVKTSSMVQDSNADEDRRHRAKHALAFMAEKRSMLKASIHRRESRASSDKSEKRVLMVAEARRLAAHGDTVGALFLVLDWIEGGSRP